MKSPLSFHFSSMTKPISFSFSLSITCSNSVIILVDLHRTFSNTPLHLMIYSRCHLQNKHCWLYGCYCSLACSSPSALHKHTVTAGLHSNSLSISIPHPFLQSYFLDTHMRVYTVAQGHSIQDAEFWICLCWISRSSTQALPWSYPSEWQSYYPEYQPLPTIWSLQT